MRANSGTKLFRFTLAGLLLLVTTLAVVLAIGRVFGYVAIALIVMGPFPAVGYMIFVRSLMRNVDANSDWSRFVGCGLAFGFAVAVLVSVILLAIGTLILSYSVLSACGASYLAH